MIVIMADHGGAGTRYEAGCRCDVCTEAHRVRVKRRRSERLAGRVWRDGSLVAVQPDLPHGSTQTYKNWGCRCEPCTAAHWAELEKHRARRWAKREFRDGIFVSTQPGLRHGTDAAYSGWGCRCGPCRAARVAAKRRWRDRQEHGT